MDRKFISVLLISWMTVLTACAPQAAPTPTAAPTTAPTLQPTEAPTLAPISLNVFAAASLTDAFTEIGKNFEAAHPNVTVVFNFAGSNQLAQQIGQGAPVDVFASANKTQMEVAIKSERVVSGTEHTFARNRLVVIFPKDNPSGVSTLQDLTKPGLKIVLAAKEVPVGQYALDFLDKAVKDTTFGASFKDDALKNVVSYEENVRAVLSKVTLGEADAGIVYTSDIAGNAADKVGRLDIPDALNTIASYPIAPLKDSPNAEVAQIFVDYVLAPEGQTVLAGFGFIPTTGNATGAAPGAVPVEITGLVNTPTTFSAADFKQLKQKIVEATDKSGEVTNRSSVE